MHVGKEFIKEAYRISRNGSSSNAINTFTTVWRLHNDRLYHRWYVDGESVNIAAFPLPDNIIRDDRQIKRDSELCAASAYMTQSPLYVQ